MCWVKQGELHCQHLSLSFWACWLGIACEGGFLSFLLFLFLRSCSVFVLQTEDEFFRPFTALSAATYCWAMVFNFSSVCVPLRRKFSWYSWLFVPARPWNSITSSFLKPSRSASCPSSWSRIKKSVSFSCRCWLHVKSHVFAALKDMWGETLPSTNLCRNLGLLRQGRSELCL